MSNAWTTLLRRPDIIPREGVTARQLSTAEHQLGVALPIDLQELYRASDGAFDAAGQD